MNFNTSSAVDLQHQNEGDDHHCPSILVDSYAWILFSNLRYSCLSAASGLSPATAVATSVWTSLALVGVFGAYEVGLLSSHVCIGARDTQTFPWFVITLAVGAKRAARAMLVGDDPYDVGMAAFHLAVRKPRMWMEEREGSRVIILKAARAARAAMLLSIRVARSLYAG